jgi:hypothetical protein
VSAPGGERSEWGAILRCSRGDLAVVLSLEGDLEVAMMRVPLARGVSSPSG